MPHFICTTCGTQYAETDGPPLGAASLVHQLMSEAEMMLLPLVLAPTASVAGQVSAPWPTVRVVESPSALHAVLANGAYAWWAAAEQFS